MSSTIDRTTHGADPWWGEPEPEVAPGFDAPVAPTRRTPARRRRTATSKPWWLRLLQLPFVLFARAVRRSPRLRRGLVRLLIVAVVSLIVAGSVGVILLNNVVIHRTAELGRLDQERRELRRDNALLDAQAATKSAQIQIVKRAGQLGMRQSSAASKYTYLEPQNAALSPVQRANRAKQLARAKRIQQQRERAAAAEPQVTP